MLLLRKEKKRQMSDFQQKLKDIKAIVFDVDGVLSGNCMVLHPDAEPLRTANVKDGYAMNQAIKRGLILGSITGGRSESVRIRYEGLGLKDVYLGASIKIDTFGEFLQKHGLKAEQVLYMGDDIPDYEVMQAAGLSACPADAVNEIKGISDYISPYAGGQGCARDVIERTMKAQGLWMNGREAFGW